MTREQLVRMGGALKSVMSMEGVKFAYAVVKNLKLIEGEIADLQKAVAIPEGMIAFEKARIELCEKMCQRDAEGKPVIENGAFAGLDKDPEFIKALEVLKVEHAEALAKRSAQEEQYKKLMAEEIEVKLHKVKVADLPSKLNANQLAMLEAMIDDAEASV